MTRFVARIGSFFLRIFGLAPRHPARHSPDHFQPGEARMSNLSPSDWKTFLEARIAQENGDDQAALRVFEDLLKIYPDNDHLQSSRAFALERLGRGEEALADRIAVKYADLGRSLIGPADRPEVWTRELTSLLEAAERGKDQAAVSPLVAW
jgi:hypothetical protein